MSRLSTLSARVRSVLALPVAMATIFGGCDALNDYHGPAPEMSSISDELAVVREVTPLTEGVVELVLDRVLYIQANPSSIDRAVVVQLDAPATALLGPTFAGDTVRFSSTYGFAGEGGRSSVPNWAINDYWEPPIAHHRVTRIEHASR